MVELISRNVYNACASVIATHIASTCWPPFIVMLGDVKWHFLILPTLINARALLVALTWLPLLTTTPVAAAITLVVGKAIIQ